LIDFAEFPALLHECEISSYHVNVKDFKKKIQPGHLETFPRGGEDGGSLKRNWLKIAPFSLRAPQIMKNSRVFAIMQEMELTGYFQGRSKG
jgi:hypothetical protein